MNIFMVDWDPREAAKDLCDQHVVKMITESAQLMATAHHLLGTHREWMYKPTHPNHPFTKWLTEYHGNYNWLFAHYHALGREYWVRYHKIHAAYHPSYSHHPIYSTTPPPVLIKKWTSMGTHIIITPPPLCVKDTPTNGSSVEVYRRYYIQHKSSFARWRHSDPPNWYTKGLKEYELSKTR